MSGLLARRCGSCELVVFPPRLLCPRCGSRDWRDTEIATGVVEQATTARSRRRPDGVALGAVRLSEGGVAIARLEDGASPGDEVVVDVRGAAIVARRRPA
jgi:uncharacterized OB-fold protein